MAGGCLPCCPLFVVPWQEETACAVSGERLWGVTASSGAQWTGWVGHCCDTALAWTVQGARP